MITARVGLLGWAKLEDVASSEFALGEDGVGESADCPLTTWEWGDEAVFGNMGEDLGGSVRGAGAEACNIHRGEVIDVVSEKAGVFEGDAELGGVVADRCGFVARALGDERDVKFLGVTVDQRGVLAGDEGHLDAEAAEQ